MDVRDRRERIEATNAGLVGSVFDDVNLSGARFTNVDLSGTNFDDVNLTNARFRNIDRRGMTIEGVPVDDLFAAYEGRKP